MKKILIFLIPILIIGGGTALALTMQDDPICVQDGHTGYTLATGASLPDASTFDPEAPVLPTGMTDEGKFGTNFNCTTSIPETCHYVYVPATENEEAKWVECKGRILRN